MCLWCWSILESHVQQSWPNIPCPRGKPQCESSMTSQTEIKVLITSLRTTFASVNLQRAYHNIILLGFPSNINTILQALGRIFRIGQSKAGKITIVTMEYTFGHVLQHKAALKMISQLSGQTDNEVFDRRSVLNDESDLTHIFHLISMLKLSKSRHWMRFY